MKLKFFILYFLAVLNCMSFVVANSNSNQLNYTANDSKLNQSRINIKPEQVHVNDNGLFIEIEGTFYQVAQICQDEQGYFIPYTGFWWICTNGHPNPPWRSTCQVCNSPY